MGEGKSRKESIRTFYEENLTALEFGNAVADVIIVPLLALNLIGVIQIQDAFSAWIVAAFAFVDVTSTAILLVAGYIGHGNPRVACASCRGKMLPVVSHWVCGECGAQLRRPRSSYGDSKNLSGNQWLRASCP